MTLKPLNNNVIVSSINGETLNKAGIVLPDTLDKERPEKGKVVSVGPNCLEGLKAGDLVFFRKYSPDEVKIDEEKFLVIREEDILAVLL